MIKKYHRTFNKVSRPCHFISLYSPSSLFPILWSLKFFLFIIHYVWDILRRHGSLGSQESLENPESAETLKRAKSRESLEIPEIPENPTNRHKRKAKERPVRRDQLAAEAAEAAGVPDAPRRRALGRPKTLDILKAPKKPITKGLALALCLKRRYLYRNYTQSVSQLMFWVSVWCITLT